MFRLLRFERWWIGLRSNAGPPSPGHGCTVASGRVIELRGYDSTFTTSAPRSPRSDPAIGLDQAIIDGASQRIRPMLMTGLTLVLGLTPVMLASGAGSDVMKRIAAPLLGGAGSALLMALVVVPALFAIWRSRGSEPIEEA